MINFVEEGIIRFHVDPVFSLCASTQIISPSTCLFEPLHREVSVPHGGAVHVAEASLSDLPGCREIVRTSPHFVRRPLHDARDLRRLSCSTASGRMLRTELEHYAKQSKVTPDVKGQS